MLTYLIFFAGIFGLWFGTRITVANAVKLAKQFGVSELFIGLTIISIGTDLPELIVTIDSSIRNIKGEDASGLLLGNAIGSCFAQAALVLGISALFSNISLSRRQTIRDSIALVAGTLILFVVSVDRKIEWYEGLVCIAGYGYYFYRLFRTEMVPDKTDLPESNKVVDVVLLVIGIAIVIVGAHYTIESALELSIRWGVSQTVVGIFVLAIGTSLPELAVALQAAAKKTVQISVGTILGSTIFDLLMPAGIGSIISPIRAGWDILLYDLPFMFILSLVIGVFLFAKRGIQKREAIVLILMYVLYTVFRLTTVIAN